MKKSKKLNEYADVLHMWEDDYLMIELIPRENVEFASSETKRINEFAKGHSDGIGFKDITAVSEAPVKTIEKKIPFHEVVEVFSRTGLEKIQKVVYQHDGLLEGEKVPFVGFGTNNFAIILENEEEFLKNIWITGSVENTVLREKLKSGILGFGTQFAFIGINWYQSDFYKLGMENEVENFMENSC